MKKSFVLLLFFISIISAFAEPVIKNGVLISWYDASGSINIPATVTSIKDSTFINNKNITSVFIPNSVTKIGKRVFLGCSALQNIVVETTNSSYSSIDGVLFTKSQQTLLQYPNARIGAYVISSQVDTIGTESFMNCSGLRPELIIPQTVRQVQSLAFSNCTGIEIISIGHADSIATNGVSIAANSFLGCNAINKIILNNNVLVSDNNSSPFKNISSIASIIIGDGVSLIPENAFINCIGLKTFQLGQSNSLKTPATIPSTAFSGCTNLTTVELNKNFYVAGGTSPFIQISTLTVGNTATFISNVAFSNCKNLISVVLPQSVVQIFPGAFQYCSNLKSIHFPGINYLGQNAFYECSALNSVNIPNTVKTIEGATFYNCIKLATISLGNSLVDIKSSAFSGCVSLTSVELPNTMKTLGEKAFFGCTSLSSIQLGSSLTSIESYAFSGCATLETISLPQTINNINSYAFEKCVSLKSLSFPGSIKAIGESAYSECTGISSITIGEIDNPGTPLTFGNFAFSGCTGVTTLTINKNIVDDPYTSPFTALTSLSKVTVNNRVTQLNTFAFYGCSSLTSITIPNSVVYIGTAAFQNCTSLAAIKLPNNLSFISNQLFYGCTSLKSVIIPPKVSSIGSYVFYKCSGLTSVTIPEKVEFIGPVAFYGCTGLSELLSANPTPPTLGNLCFSSVPVNTCILNIPLVSKSAYSIANQWSNFANIVEKTIPTDTTQINDSTNLYPESVLGVVKTITINAGGLFSSFNAKELASINKLKISGSIDASDFQIMRDQMPLLNVLDLSNASIESYTGWYGTNGYGSYPANTIPIKAFENKTSLFSIKLPANVTAIGDKAFKYCSILQQELQLPPELTSIGNEAFYGCIGFYGTLTIPSNVTYIGQRAFERCKGIIKVKILSEMNAIEYSTFAGCENLMMIDLPSSVKSIKGSAFYDCGRLFIVNIPSVTTIADNVFAKCNGLSAVTLPSTVTSIGDYAFAGCSSLKEIKIPSSMTRLGNSLFTDCISLTSVTLPSTLTTIGAEVFVKCRSLSSIYIYSIHPPTILYQMLFYYINLNTCVLWVPKGSLNLYMQAEQWNGFLNIREMTNTDLNRQTVHPISFYPNPFIDGINITGLTNPGLLTVFNLNGVVLLLEKVIDNKYISLSNLPKGTYIVRISSIDGVTEKKMIKE